MDASREKAGRETYRRLRHWSGRGQTQAERLAAQLLRAEGFEGLDPSHPLGGRDGLKDLVCTKDGQKWIAAAYFPNDPVPLSQTKAKFEADLEGVKANDAVGFAFITNQELTVSERKSLQALHDGPTLILHLERIAQLLDSPGLYGVRLEFLEIPMNTEEQVGYFTAHSELSHEVKARLDAIFQKLESEERPNTSALADAVLAVTSSRSDPVEPASVAPFIVHSGYGSTGLAYGLLQKRVNKCSYCGFGFLIEGGSAMTTIVGMRDSQAVACPKCGNVDTVSAF